MIFATTVPIASVNVLMIIADDCRLTAPKILPKNNLDFTPLFLVFSVSFSILPFLFDSTNIQKIILPTHHTLKRVITATIFHAKSTKHSLVL
jgi:hypothetical protein